MFNIPETVLAAISAEEFLADYWQQKPLLLRAAWPDFDPNLEPEELAGLALESTIDSRLVIEKKPAEADRPSEWTLREPPFTEQDFTSLPQRNWSLLVNDIDKHLPEFQEILAAFSFLPSWRIDDLMISYAAPGGSVGPHTDDYDVFLIQAYGQRHWHINQQPVSPDNYLPDTDLRIMKSFETEDDWVLNPGDILYLPPGIAHHGIAIDRCMTYSVGFRAPTNLALLDQFIDHCYDNEVKPARFTDPKRRIADNPTDITQADVGSLRDLLTSALSLPDDEFQAWLGKTLSLPKKIIDTGDHIVEEVNFGDQVQLHPASTVTSIIVNNQRHWFVDGIALGAIPTISEHLLSQRTAIVISEENYATDEQKTFWRQLSEHSLLISPSD